MTMAGAWHRLERKIRLEGPVYTLQSLAHRFLPELFYVNSFVIFALDPERFSESAPAATETDAPVREAELADIDRLAINGRSRELVRERFAHGARAWILERNGRTLGHAWLDPGGLLSEHCLWLTAGPGDVWAMDGWVDPALRGKGNYTRVKSRAAEVLFGAGKCRILSLVDALNRSSIRANRAIGSRPVARGAVVRLFGISLVVFQGHWHLGHWTPRRPLRLALKDQR
jgi:hypothetical protein